MDEYELLFEKVLHVKNKLRVERKT
jgi:hypothetical protein